MPSAKKILITTESHEIFTLRLYGDRGVAGFCPRCNAEVEMLSLELAVFRSRIHTRQLVKLVDTSVIHAVETNTGHYLVCADSVQAYLSEEPEGKEK